MIATPEPASADPFPEHEWWNEFDGLGLTKLDRRVDVPGDYWKVFAIVHPQQHSACDSGTNLANQANEAADLGGAVQTTYAPGSTGYFCIEVNEGWAGGSGTGNLDFFQTVTFKLKDDDGTTLPGSASITNPGNWHQMQSGSIAVQMDAEPFDGQPDAPLAPGWYEMFLELTTQNECTPDPCNSHGQGRTSHYGRGFIYVSQGYLFGAHPDGNSTSELTQEQASSGINKNMSLVRDYKPTWATPSSRVNTWAGQGKSVVWSAKPPAWSGGQSPWARAAADTAMIDNQIRSLQASANQTGGPAVMFYAVSHEPHDNASDTTQGWNNGASNRKCGSTSSPSVGDASHDPCLGTAAEFKALYHQMRLRQQSACNASGGTTSPYGSRCGKVLLMYTAVASNMTPGTVVGDDDLMRPASDDFDVFGGDVFNWGCFRKSIGTCTDAAHGNNNEWKDFEQLIDDPTSDNTLLDLAQSFAKPAFVTELGSHPGCNGSETTNKCNGSNTWFDRSTWFQNMDRYLTFDREANRYLLGYSYFHEFQSHDWRFIDTTAGGDVDNRGFTQYKAAVADPMYRSTAAGYDVTLRTPVPDSHFYSYSAASVETPYSERARNAQRKRHGASGWVPRQIGFSAERTTYAGNNANKLKFSFRYFQPEHQRQADDYMQTLEITADIPCVNGQSPWGGDWFGSEHVNGYEPGLWNTNVPAAALPHEDNFFYESENDHPWNKFVNDDCGPDNRASIGFGIGNVSALVNNTEYTVELGTYCQTACTSNTAVQLVVQTGTMYDIEVPLLRADNADCKWDPATELNKWNDALLGYDLRYEASWCNFIDYEATAVFAAQDIAHTGVPFETLGLNWLYNQGMEEAGFPGYGFIGHSGTYDAMPFCDAYSYDGSCYTKFNSWPNGGASSIYQDITPYPGPVFGAGSGNTTRYTGEAMLRCPEYNAGGCNITMALRGMGITSPDSVSIATFPLPDDSKWYRCRVDYDHGMNGWNANHSKLRWEVYNMTSGRDLDIDFTYLGGRHRELDPRLKLPLLSDVGGVGHVTGNSGVPANCSVDPQ